jgi:hypothetical protein
MLARSRIPSRPCPVVLFSPGLSTNVAFYSGLLQDLASRGFAVFGVDHTFDALVEFPDGRIELPVENADPATFLAVRVDDLRQVRDRLAQHCRVAAMGHSLGSMTVIGALERDSRFASGVAIDGNPLGEASLAQPFLMMGNPSHTRATDPIGPPSTIGCATRACTWWCTGAEHYLVSDLTVFKEQIELGGVFELGAIGGRRAMHIGRTYLGAWLGQTLWDARSVAAPRVSRLRRGRLSALTLGGLQARSEGHARGLNPVGDTELAENGADVALDGALRHEQRGAYVRIGHSLAQQRQHLPLPVGQRGHQLVLLLGELGAALRGLVHDLFGDSGVEHGHTVGSRPKRSEELFGRRVFEHETDGPGGDGLGDVLLVAEGGKDDDAGRTVTGHQFPGGGEAVQPRHAYVHEDQIGFEPAGHGQRIFAVRGRPDHLKSLSRVNYGGEPTANDVAVVDDEDPDHLSISSPMAAVHFQSEETRVVASFIWVA